MITDLIEKIINGERLSDEEHLTALDWFRRADGSAQVVNPLTGQVSGTQADISAMVQQETTANMGANFPRLSDITTVLGTIIAGEFRSGNFQAPGDGFTGGRFGYPGFTYGGTEYFLAGVINDVLQVGLALDDGKLYGGGGNVVIDVEGITMANSASSWFRFEDANGNFDTITIAADPNSDFEFTNLARSPNGTISFFLKDTAGTTRRAVRILEDPVNANTVQLDVSPGIGTSSKLSLGGEVVIWAQKNGQTTLFNSGGYNIDFKIFDDFGNESFFVDASAATLKFASGNIIFTNSQADFFTQMLFLDDNNVALSVFGDDVSNSQLHIASGGALTINGQGADSDTVIQGNTDTSLVIVDAGLDAVGIGGAAASGKKLKVTGDTSLDGALIVNDSGADKDTIIEGDTDTSLFIADAGLDAVGIGGAAASGYKLKVTGNANITGNLDLGDSTIRSKFVTLSDDTATSFTPDTGIGGMIVMATAGAGNGGFAGYNTSTGAAAAIVSGTNFAATSGTLSGTTGTDGKVTVSAHTDGKIYIENRLGATRNFAILLI